MHAQKTETKSRLLAKLIRDLLAAERFDTLADLTDVLKTSCARLRIRCDADDVNDAFRIIESNRALVDIARPARPGRPLSTDNATLGKLEAADLCRRLAARDHRLQVRVLR